MKRLFKFIIGKILSVKARQYLQKYNVEVIGITGSVGKTSTKEAIYTALKRKFKVYRSKKSFNTELGISLAILQEDESGFSSPIEWLKILYRVFFKPKEVYEKMILEMGADRRGDIKKLVKIAKPKIGVITHIAPVHMDKDQFNDIYDIAQEKENLIKSLPKDGIAVINSDDPLINKMMSPARKITYGIGDEAMIKAHNVKSTSKSLSFKVTYKGVTEDFTISILGKFQIYIFLPAIAIGLEMGMTLKECATALAWFSLPPGRMNLIEGVNRSMIIDGSYNASPETMKKALELLKELRSDRKIAVLGTMNELGKMAKEAHVILGQNAAAVANMIIAVGPEAATIKQGALEAGFAENKLFTFLDSEEAGHFLKDDLCPRDLVLVKGSQNRVRMEKLVKVIMAHPEKAAKLLCRQGKAWNKI